MITELLGAAMSGMATGGLTSLIGLGIKAWSDQKAGSQRIEEKRLDFEHARLLSQQEAENRLRIAQLEGATAERLAEIDGMARADAQAGADFRESHQSDTARYTPSGALSFKDASGRWGRFTVGAGILMMSIVDFVRGITRPGITVYAMVLETMLLYWVHDLWMRQQLSLAPDQQAKIVMEVVGTASYIISTSVTWWFGVRSMARARG